MKEIRILSLAAAYHVVVAYSEICNSLERKGYDVHHLGIDTDHWYGGNSKKSYQEFKYSVKSLPRPSKKNTPWWQTPDILLEANGSLEDIFAFMEEIVTTFKPNCFLIADDCGQLEVFLMQLINQKKVKIVLIEHGFGNAFNHSSNLLMGDKIKTLLYKSYNLLKNKLLNPKKIRKSIDSSKATEDIVNLIESETLFGAGSLGGKDSSCLNLTLINYKLPMVKVFGTNLDTPVCAYSLLTYENLRNNHKIASERLFLTGYPYFDGLIRMRDSLSGTKSLIRQNNNRPKILFVSTGHGLFGDFVRANIYYSCLAKMIIRVSNQFDVYLRLKPNEILTSFLENKILEEFNSLKFTFDDNTIPFTSCVLNYDLVIGESSTTLVESIALWIPVILINLNMKNKKRYKITYEDILSDILKVKTINCDDDILKAVNVALSQKYISSLQNSFVKNQDILFYKIDGLSGERIANVILEEVML